MVCRLSEIHTAMDIEKDGDKDETKAYLPGLGQGDKLAEDEELVADMSCMCVCSARLCTWLIWSLIQPTYFSITHA